MTQQEKAASLERQGRLRKGSGPVKATVTTSDHPYEAAAV